MNTLQDFHRQIEKEKKQKKDRIKNSLNANLKFEHYQRKRQELQMLKERIVILELDLQNYEEFEGL